MISKTLSNFNISELTPMQQTVMKTVAEPGDVVLISPTGTGKTLAYLLPLVQLFKKEPGVQAVIIVPTRELALQIEQVFKQMGTGYKISCCYGGHSVQTERNNLVEVPSVLIGTPGRLTHHLRKKNILITNAKYLVLDEFDKSLEAGFGEEMAFIIQQIKHPAKRILISATELLEIPTFVGIKQKKELVFEKDEKSSVVAFKKVRVEGDDKIDALILLLGKLDSQSSLVFCNHREAVSRISEQCGKLKISHGIYHGGMDQVERQKTLIKLRNGSIRILITTDLAARGLDIPGIDAVIHYQLPATEDVMIHRNGRTARMGKSGTVYFLLDKEEFIPPFLSEEPGTETLPKKIVVPPPPEWKTLYISAGKKDKVNKMDIVGMLLQKGKLNKEDLGLIEVLDYAAYAAIKSSMIVKTVQLIKEERIKNKKVKIEIST